jgi:hypothetical protein
MKKLIIGVVSVAVSAFGLVTAQAATDPRAHKEDTTLRLPCAPEGELEANHLHEAQHRLTSCTVASRG